MKLEMNKLGYLLVQLNVNVGILILLYKLIFIMQPHDAALGDPTINVD